MLYEPLNPVTRALCKSFRRHPQFVELMNVSFCLFAYLSICNRLIGLVGRIFANGPEDLGSIPGRVIQKTFKIVLDTHLLNIQQYKVHIKGKGEQSRDRSSALSYTSV